MAKDVRKKKTITFRVDADVYHGMLEVARRKKIKLYTLLQNLTTSYWRKLK